MSTGGGGMTLVFALSALQRLVRPDEAITDAHRWSEHIGVISDNSTDLVTAFSEEWEIEPDFISGVKGTAGSLAIARQRFPSDRHVFVGTATENRQLAQSLGWEYRDIAEAAAAADWPLATETDGSSTDAIDE